MAMRPLQKPYPPIWYGSSNTIGSRWAGEHGLHFTANGQMATAKPNIDAFKDAFAKGGSAAIRSPNSRRRGDRRHSPDRRRRNRRRGAAHRPAGFRISSGEPQWLRDRARAAGGSDLVTRLNVRRGSTFEECTGNGMVIAGSPETVRAAIEREMAELGTNYLLAYLFFGTLTYAEAQALARPLRRKR